MGIFDLVGKAVSGAMKAAGVGKSSLKEAYENALAPNKPGVYKVFLHGELMKVGKAEDGLRKRFSDYYRGEQGGTAGLKYITSGNRDEVKVQWKECPKNRCRAIENQMYDQAKERGLDIPWSDRR